VLLRNIATSETNSLKVSESPVDLAILSPHAHSLVTTGRGRSTRWWDMQSGTNLALGGDAQKIIFARDGQTMATLRRGNSVELWDVTTRAVRTNFIVDAQLGFEAALSADGRVLAVGCSDATVRLLDTATGKVLGACIGHKQDVFSIAFSPDGKTLATASDDSTLKLWNVATQQELLTIRRLGGALRGLIFHPMVNCSSAAGVSRNNPGPAILSRAECELMNEATRANTRRRFSDCAGRVTAATALSSAPCPAGILRRLGRSKAASRRTCRRSPK